MIHSSPLPKWLNSVHHDGSDRYVSNLNPRLGERVRVWLRVDCRAPVRGVYLRTFPDGEQHLAPMEPGNLEPPVQWWQADLTIDQPVVNYRFAVLAADGIWFYSAAGPSAHIPGDATDFRLLADYETPDWLPQAVFYQIFPDRFANGDPSNDLRQEEFEFRGMRPQTFPWGAMPSPEAFPSLIFYGGDIPGIVQRLDYLQSLGVNALYLNPIFTAFTNHKYDVIDYEQVDPHLGGNEALIALRRALDERDMHYILDIVPNHAGYWHPWFQSARQNPNAPEAEFFTFHQHPDHYASWLGVWTLPKLNYRSQELRRRVYAGPKATFRYWLQPPYSADGWRIDVANMLARQGADQMGEEVARGIRQAVKQTRPDAYLLGENFFDAVQQLQGDQWDGVMNYQGLKSPLLHWLRGYRQGSHGMKEQIHSPVPWTTIALEGTWRTQRAAIPWAIALQQYNLVDSHDTQRIRSAVEGNDALHRLAGVVQFTYPGVPGIYYGDEIGMADLPVLGPRGCMPWDEGRWDHGLLQFYKQLIALRRQSTTLQHGGFQIISLEEDSFTYQRESNHGRILVIANRSIHPRPAGPLPVAHAGIPEGTRFVEYFTNQEARVEGSAVQMPELPQGATIWTEIH